MNLSYKINLIVIVFLAGILAMGTFAQAGTWTVQYGADPYDMDNVGVLTARNLGENAAVQTVNGITFAAYDDSNLAGQVRPVGWPEGLVYNGPDTAMFNVLNTGNLVQDWVAPNYLSITLDNLVVGDEYTFQLLIAGRWDSSRVRLWGNGMDDIGERVDLNGFSSEFEVALATYTFKADAATREIVHQQPTDWNQCISLAYVFSGPLPGVITQQPQGQRVGIGDSADFEVEVAAPTEFTVSYQWYYSETAIAIPTADTELIGETSSILSLTDIEEADGGYYYCVISFVSAEDSFELTSDAAPLVFPKYMFAEEVWSIQFQSSDAWENAGGRRYTTFNTGAGDFTGNLLAGSGNPLGPIGGFIGTNVGTTANNAPTHDHPGPGWAYIPTGVAWQPNTTYKIDFIVLQRSGAANDSIVEYGLWAGLPSDDKGAGDYRTLFSAGEKPGQAATRPALGGEGNIQIASSVLNDGDGIFVSDLEGASGVDATFRYTTGSDVSGLGDMVLFIRTATARIHWDSVSIYAFDADDVLDIEDENRQYQKLSDTVVNMSGRSELHLTGADAPLTNCQINLNSENSWLFFRNVRTSVVNDDYFGQIRVNGSPAVLDENVRLVQYAVGTVVIPHSPDFEPLEVYSGIGFSGPSTKLGLYTYYRQDELGAMNNSIRSFRLKRGYMATFAQEADGMGTSKVYMANDRDLDIAVMPAGLDNSVSFVRVFPWRWPTKKGYCSARSDRLDKAEAVNASWYYTWGAGDTSTLNLEYAPMRHNRYWDAYSKINEKQNSTHVLGFNEPEHPPQHEDTGGVISVEEAIQMWPNLMESGLRLGSPAPTDGGLLWLYDFIDEADALGYRVDFVAIHLYLDGLTVWEKFNRLKQIHERTGRPLWITEWNDGATWNSDLPTYEEHATRIQQFLNMLNNADFVERYAYYEWVGHTRQLFYDEGGMTPTGVVYRDTDAPLAIQHGINPAPPIDVLRHPQRQVAYSGSDAFFEVAIAGASHPPLTYQWYRSEDSVIEPSMDTPVGTNSNVLEIEAVQSEDEGFYYCRISDSNGNVVHTEVARLDVAVFDPERKLLHHWKLDDEAAWDWDDDASWTAIVDLANTDTESYIITGYRQSNRDAVLFGQPSATSRTDASIKFGGSNERAELGFVSPGINNFTIMFWFKMDQFHGGSRVDHQNHILSSDTDQEGGWSIHLWGDEDFLAGNEDKPRLDFFHEGYDNITLIGAVEEDQWYHVTLARDRYSNFRIYIDDQMVHSGANPVRFDYTDAGVWLAKRPTDNSAFDGWIDDVRIYNYAVDDIPDLTGNERIGIEDLAVFIQYWLMDDCGACGGADINLDRKVEFTDFTLFAEQWLAEKD